MMLFLFSLSHAHLSIASLLPSLHKSLTFPLLQHTWIPTVLYPHNMHTANPRNRKPCFFLVVLSLPCICHCFLPFLLVSWSVTPSNPPAVAYPLTRMETRQTPLLRLVWANFLISDQSNWTLISERKQTRKGRTRRNEQRPTDRQRIRIPATYCHHDDPLQACVYVPILCYGCLLLTMYTFLLETKREKQKRQQKKREKKMKFGSSKPVPTMG